MHKVYSQEPLEAVAYYKHDGQLAEVYLRENIETEELHTLDDSEDAEPAVRYQADEIYFRTRHTREYVEEHFDELWVAAEKAEQPITERLNEVEELLGALIDLELAKEE